MTTGPLSQIDIDALLLELGPRIDTEQHRAELGTVVYQAYVPFFGELIKPAPRQSVP